MKTLHVVTDSGRFPKSLVNLQNVSLLLNWMFTFEHNVLHRIQNRFVSVSCLTFLSSQKTYIRSKQSLNIDAGVYSCEL